METRFDRDAVRALIEAAGEQLTGEWLLVGGAVAAVWFSADRLTEDIDLVGLGGTLSERDALMDLAAARGLPIEAVNSAADYFVRRIPGFRAEIEVLHAGSRATIYRPSVSLFLLLKVGRLSEKDLLDCTDLLAYARRTGLALDPARVLGALDALDATEDAALAARRAELRAAVLRAYPR